MKVMNKKTGLLHDVPKEQWEQMRLRNETRKYSVVDGSDDNVLSEEISVEPVKMYDHDDMAEKGEPKLVTDQDAEAEYYREKLREADVPFHPNTGIEKLKQKYEAL